jgi:hypothetical protein
MRDVQMSLVYAWQKVAYPKFWESKLLNSEVRALVNKVHQDVILAGGWAVHTPEVKFTKRAGGACASWGRLNFTPHQSTLYLVLHEIAHSLTYLTSKARRELLPTKGEDFKRHVDRYVDVQGHGPRYVACLIALVEKYAGCPSDTALLTACDFKYDGWGPWQPMRQVQADGSVRRYKQRARTTKRGSVRVDVGALRYWRELLA